MGLGGFFKGIARVATAVIPGTIDDQLITRGFRRLRGGAPRRNRTSLRGFERPPRGILLEIAARVLRASAAPPEATACVTRGSPSTPARSCRGVTRSFRPHR